MDDVTKSVINDLARQIDENLARMTANGCEVYIQDGAIEIFYVPPEPWQFNPPADISLNGDGDTWVRPQ